MAELLIEAEVDGFRGKHIQTYEVTKGRYIKRYAHNAAMQEHWVPESEYDPDARDYSWDPKDIRTWYVTCDGSYIGCFRDREHFFEHVKYYMRGSIIDMLMIDGKGQRSG